MFARRELLKCGLAAGAAGMAGLPVQALAQSLEPRRIAIHNLHTGEALNAVYWENGKYVADAVDALNKVLRDFRTGDVHMMDPGLYDILDAISAKVESRKPFQIISGYRSPKTNTMLQKTGGGGVATRSLHMDGKAMDVRLDGVGLNNVHKAALSLKKGGVGLYPVSNFVHVDVGRVRTWSGA
jgi:uncharacterized protein YcbK (DUF882 family)